MSYYDNKVKQVLDCEIDHLLRFTDYEHDPIETLKIKPEVALIIKREWCKEIFQGTKVWEVRGCRTKKRGTIAVAQSGDQQLVGELEIIDCFPIGRRHHGVIVPWDDTQTSGINFIGAQENISKHCIPNLEVIQYDKIFAWVLSNKRAYPNPIAYKHPLGCVQWVKLEPQQCQQVASAANIEYWVRLLFFILTSRMIVISLCESLTLHGPALRTCEAEMKRAIQFTRDLKGGEKPASSEEKSKEEKLDAETAEQEDAEEEVPAEDDQEEEPDEEIPDVE